MSARSGFKIISRSEREHEYDSCDADEEFSRPSTYTTHEIKDVLWVEEHPDCLGAFWPHVGQDVFLVSVIYSTGDSFGRDAGYGLEHVAVFSSKEKAELCVKQIEAHAYLVNALESVRSHPQTLDQHISNLAIAPPLDKNGNWDFKKWQGKSSMAWFVNDLGEFEACYTPWIGYFEGIDSVEINTFKIKSEPKTKPRSKHPK